MVAGGIDATRNGEERVVVVVGWVGFSFGNKNGGLGGM